MTPRPRSSILLTIPVALTVGVSLLGFALGFFIAGGYALEDKGKIWREGRFLEKSRAFFTYARIFRAKSAAAFSSFASGLPL